MSITLQQAKELKPGQMVHTPAWTNSDGTPQRWKVNGQPKVWKRSPERVQVPLKHGLYDYGCLTENELHLFELGDGQ